MTSASETSKPMTATSEPFCIIGLPSVTVMPVPPTVDQYGSVIKTLPVATAPLNHGRVLASNPSAMPSFVVMTPFGSA